MPLAPERTPLPCIPLGAPWVRARLYTLLFLTKESILNYEEKKYIYINVFIHYFLNLAILSGVAITS